MIVCAELRPGGAKFGKEKIFVMASKKRRTRTRREGLVASLRDPKKITIAYIVAGIALVFGGSLGFGASNCGEQMAPPNPYQTNSATDSIAAVQDRVITYQQFREAWENSEMMNQQNIVLRAPEATADAQYRTLRQLIDMEYFDIRAGEIGIVVTDDEVEAELDTWREQLIPASETAQDRSLLQRFGDFLSSAKRDQAFEARIKALNPGLSIDKLRKLIRQKIMSEKYVKELQENIRNDLMTDLMANATQIREDVSHEVKTFQEYAMEESDHQESAASGGFIPLLKRDDTSLPAAVVTNAFTLPIGEISDPIPVNGESPDLGVWMVTVVSRKEASGTEWDEARPLLYDQLLQEKREKVEAGELELPEDGNLIIDEDELKNAYEEANIRVIFLQADDPMQKVQENVNDDIEKMNIVINDPELRATHHMYLEQYDLAAHDLYEALDANFNRPAQQGDIVDIQYAIDAEEARLRYLIGNFWATLAFLQQRDWFMAIQEDFFSNPDMIDGEFPEVPEAIELNQQGYFVLSLLNLNRAIEIEDRQPFAHKQRASINITREQLTPALIHDIQTAYEFSSDSFDLVNEVRGLVNAVVTADDKAVEAAGGERPDPWVAQVLPEEELGITLADTDQNWLPDETQTDTITPEESGEMAETDETPQAIDEAPPGANDDAINPDTPVEDADVTDDSSEGSTVGEDMETPESPEIRALPGVPIVQKATASRPLSAEDRQTLEDLQAEIEVKYQELLEIRQQQQAEQDAMRQQQIQQLPVNEPDEPPSDDAVGLLTDE